jgi:hypothetical protein
MATDSATVMDSVTARGWVMATDSATARDSVTVRGWVMATDSAQVAAGAAEWPSLPRAD